MAAPDTTPLPRHGGDLAYATRTYGEPKGGWLDLSTGINPAPYPRPDIAPDAFHRLPDAAALARLIDAARTAYAAPAGVDIVAVPGTEIAIRLLPLIAPPGAVAIVAPTYGSHGDAWRITGRDVTEVASIDAIAAGTVIAVVTNPNNPDGRIVPPAALAPLARRLSLLVVDEAFADAAPTASIVPAMHGTSAVVLRSLGKFYGLAGVRLGFVLAAPEFAARLAAYLGDWPVSGPAIAIGAAALADAAWRDATRVRLQQAAAALRALLAGHGLAVIGGTDLFVLIETPDTQALHRALAARGIWTRVFADHPRWLRLGLPDPAGMDRLAAALSAPR